MSNKRVGWKNFIDEGGNFQLSTYIYLLMNSIMKSSLDLGTLLSDDPQKLRAYKEQIKRSHKEAWADVAEALEEFGIIERCHCTLDQYCEVCKGSRYIPSSMINSDLLITHETFTVAQDPAQIASIQRKLLGEESDG